MKGEGAVGGDCRVHAVVASSAMTVSAAVRLKPDPQAERRIMQRADYRLAAFGADGAMRVSLPPSAS